MGCIGLGLGVAVSVMFVLAGGLLASFLILGMSWVLGGAFVFSLRFFMGGRVREFLLLPRLLHWLGSPGLVLVWLLAVVVGPFGGGRCIMVDFGLLLLLPFFLWLLCWWFWRFVGPVLGPCWGCVLLLLSCRLLLGFGMVFCVVSLSPELSKIPGTVEKNIRNHIMKVL